MKAALKEYFKNKNDIDIVYLFGSKAKGTETHLSDTDIAVLLKDNFPLNKSFEYKLDILNNLKKLLKSDNIDITILNTSSPLLQYQVVRYGKIIFAADDFLPFRYKARTISDYLDIKPMLDFFTKDAVKKIRSA